MGDAPSFWASWFVWRDAMAAAVLSAAALSSLGVWVALKRVVYVPLALSQVSSVGVVAAFLLGDLLARGGVEGAFFDPAWMSLLFAALASLYFARAREKSGDATAVAYLLSAAAVLILGGFIRNDIHDIQSILFGDAVLVEMRQVVIVASVAALATATHALFYRRFLFASFDGDTAGAAGIPVFRTEALLFVSLAVTISVATRVIGALPAFGFTVLPPLAALRLGGSMRRVMILSTAIGIFSAGVGYYLSFIWELPTGACMVALMGMTYLAGRTFKART
ncbi:MAG: metal ABC transporter permease [Myxococcales bacterium]|nr:MAG: metal ABC transporter permease [Myxococcales bacterium]